MYCDYSRICCGMWYARQPHSAHQELIRMVRACNYVLTTNTENSNMHCAYCVELSHFVNAKCACAIMTSVSIFSTV